jgi:hypothetical protein
MPFVDKCSFVSNYLKLSRSSCRITQGVTEISVGCADFFQTFPPSLLDTDDNCKLSMVSMAMAKNTGLVRDLNPGPLAP